MSYDLNVLCVNQRNVLNMPFATSIEIRNELDFPDSSRYHSIWPFMSSINGVWYTLGKAGESGFNALSIISSDFDKEIGIASMPYWLLCDDDYDDIKSNITPIAINDIYKKDVESVMHVLIQQSPSNMIMFLARYQGGEKEIIQGVVHYSKFKQLLNQSKVFFNTCYIITS